MNALLSWFQGPIRANLVLVQYAGLIDAFNVYFFYTNIFVQSLGHIFVTV